MMTQEVITPQKAKEYLQSNSGNRPVNRRMVLRYAQDIADGRWMVSSQAIGFDINNRLVDGQHRLMACVEANAPFTTYVARGLEPETFKVIDTGYGRTGGQIARIAGIDNANACMALMTNALLYEVAVGRTGISHAMASHYSSAMKLEMIKADLDRVQDSATRARRAYDRCRVVIPSLMGGLHYVVSKSKKQLADEFVEAIGTGEGLVSGDPRLTLRNRLIDRGNKIHKERIEFLMPLHIYAWNAFVEGRRVKKLAFRTGDAVPKLIR
jgi:hypothetical protein